MPATADGTTGRVRMVLAFDFGIVSTPHCVKSIAEPDRMMQGKTGMDIVLLNEHRAVEWRRYIENAHQAAFAHELEWRNVVEKTYRHTPYYLMAIDADTVAGLLPLFLVRSPFFGRFLVTAPYLSHGGLLAEDEQVAGALVEAARMLAVQKRVEYVEIRGLDKIGQGLRLKEKYCTYLLPLDSDPELVWSGMEKRARNTVRKAMKSGLLVEQGPHLLSDFARASNRLMHELGTPFHGEAFFRNILTEFKDRAQIFMVRHRDGFIGGGLTVTFRETIAWVYGGCLKAYRDTAAMNLLTWEIIRYACQQGLGQLDFGRSQWDSGSALFKRQWGAHPVPLFYMYDVLERKQLPDIDPTSKRFQLAITIWKRLPFQIAKALGPHVIRGLA